MSVRRFLAVVVLLAPWSPSSSMRAGRTEKIRKPCLQRLQRSPPLRRRSPLLQYLRRPLRHRRQRRGGGGGSPPGPGCRVHLVPGDRPVPQ